MPRLVTKFKYLKSTDRLSAGGYAEYIATREGAERIDDSQRLLPATEKQKKLIRRLLKDFPDSKHSLEHEDYLQAKTVGAASEFISRTIEEHADQALDTKTYADYIATRPRAERFGSHALFTDDGVPVQLSKVSEDLNQHTGNISDHFSAPGGCGTARLWSRRTLEGYAALPDADNLGCVSHSHAEPEVVRSLPQRVPPSACSYDRLL